MISSYKFIFVFILFIGFSFCLPSTVFTQGPSLISLLQKYNPQNIEDSFYVVQSLKLLNSNVDSKTELCDLSNNILNNPDNIQSVYYATFTSESLGCGKRANEKLAKYLFSTAADAETTEDIFYSVSSAYKLKEKKHLSFTSNQFSDVIDTLSELNAMDGTFKNSFNDQRGTLYHTGLAFKVISLITSSGDVHPSSLDGFKETVEELLELYTETEDGAMYIDNGDSRTSYSVTDAFLSGSFDLVDDTDIFIEAEILEDITEHILINIPFNNLKDVYHFSHLLNLLTSDNFPKTIVLSLPKTIFSAPIKNGGNIIARISDLAGNSIPGVKVFLMKASNFYDDKTVYSNQLLTKVNDKDFEFNFFSSKPQQGFYNLEFGVQVGSDSIRSTHRTIKIVTSVSVSSISIDVIDSADKEIIQTITTLADKQFTTFKASYFLSLDFSFTIKNKANNKPTIVQQAFIRFAGKHSEISIPVTPSENGYHISLDLKNVGKDLLYISGEYSVFLIIGDSFIDNSFIWELGSIDISFPPTLEIHGSESVYLAKPDIEHQFRVPEKRPSEAVSFGFSIGVITPIFILFVGFLITGMPVKIPSGLGFISSIVFIACFYAIFANFAAYWLGYYNMFKTLQYLLLLSIPTIIFGHRALREKSFSRREATEKKKVKDE